MVKLEQENELWTMVTQEVLLSTGNIMLSYSWIVRVVFEGKCDMTA